MKKIFAILLSVICSVVVCCLIYIEVLDKNHNNNIYQPEIIYFDYDNTIEDNSNWKEDLNYALKKNLDKATMNKINKIQLDADKWTWVKNNLSKETFDKIQIDNNLSKIQRTYSPIIGAMGFLETALLFGVDTYVVSQRWDIALNKLVDRANLRKYFKNFYGTGTFAGLQKPQPEFAEAILKDTNGKGKKCWMIGDARSDVKTAQQLGCLAFIISNEEKKEITETYGDLIGKKVFFVSYQSLSYLLSSLILK